VFATWITRQTMFDGVVNGAVFGLVAMGIVLVYRSTKVINFAVVHLGLFGAGLFALLQRDHHVPFWLAAAAGLAVGTLFGALAELGIVRRLFTAPRVIVLVATIGIAQLCQALLIALPEIKTPGAKFPRPIGATHTVFGVRVAGPQLTILIVAPVLAAALGWALNRTALGKAVKASADNPELARLASISPKLVSTAVWSIAGALATISMSLLGGQAGSANTLAVSFGFSTLVRSLAAAVLGGMGSFWLAFAAGIGVGVAEALMTFNYARSPGTFDFVIFLVILAAVYRRSRAGAVESRTFSFGAKVRPVPERLRSLWWIRNLDRIGFLALGLAAAALPLLVTKPSRHLTYTSILTIVICGLSLTVLTGWGGQLSLGQMSFAAMGAYLTAHLTKGLNYDLKIGATRLVRAGIRPLPFPLALLVAVVATAAIAALVGLTSLRTRGLLLAVTTLAFALAAGQYLFRRPIFTGGSPGDVQFKRTTFLGVSVAKQRPYFYVVLVITALVIAAIAKLRRTGIARTTIAVRDNPDTAAAYSISATRVRMRAFALAGALAALGGGLYAWNVQVIPRDRFFTVGDSLSLVAVVVIGGLGSVGGAVLGAAWVIGLPALFPHNDVVRLLSSSLGLLVLLMYFPSGFIQIGYSIRDAAVRWALRRHPDEAVKTRDTVPTLPSRRELSIPAATPALRTSGVTVRFGGNTAVSEVSIEVGQGEVVGLIGTNGAGKSTLMNAIGGFVPSTGRVEVFGHEVSRLPSHKRAALGLGRTFQSATLFPELTVTETVLVALEARRPTGSLAAAIVSPVAAARERARRSHASEIIDFLGLGRYADIHIADLSTGTRRIVELAGLLAVDARLLCLDEPTAGLAQKETEAFGPLVLAIRRELDAAVLVIEHDMPLIMGISDRVYCLESGRVIASGAPLEVRHNPAVVASYLGTDEAAIARSGTIGSSGGIAAPRVQ
jgi:ABC-type branched-subunit amino acid transport system ATPase component/ABC-type branched-subunit amino acid transport system permease subunit